MVAAVGPLVACVCEDGLGGPLCERPGCLAVAGPFCCPKGCRPPRQRVRNDKSERNSPGCRNIRSQEDRPRTSTSGQGPRARVHAHTTRCRLSAPQARHPTWIFTWVVVGSLIAHITHHELKQVAGPSSLPLAVLPAQHQRRHLKVTTARLCLIRRPGHFQFSQASTL